MGKLSEPVLSDPIPVRIPKNLGSSEGHKSKIHGPGKAKWNPAIPIRSGRSKTQMAAG
jgi:hypothetical protein